MCFLLHVPLTTVFKNGTEDGDYCNGVAIMDYESVIIAGYTRGDWGSINSGYEDFVAVKLDAAGEYDWIWQVRSCSRRDVLWYASVQTKLIEKCFIDLVVRWCI